MAIGIVVTEFYSCILLAPKMVKTEHTKKNRGEKNPQPSVGRNLLKTQERKKKNRRPITAY